MKLIRYARYGVEALAIGVCFGIFRLLPIDAASWLGGMIGRHLAIRHKTSNIARKNIQRAIPEITAEQREKIIGDMWENVGRTVGEYPHLARKIITDRIAITPDITAIFDEAKASNRSAIFAAGHLANWELPPIIGNIHGLATSSVYRPANNPLVDSWVRNLRLNYCADLWAKGPDAARSIIKAVKAGRSIGMLVDQKMNNGIAVPFFGRDAMTAPAIAATALKYDIPVYMIRSIRTNGANFSCECAPLDFTPTGDNAADIPAMMLAINQVFERWIRDTPEQWFWMHNRWPKDEQHTTTEDAA